MINFEKTFEKLKDTGFSPVPDPVYISIPEAKKVLWYGLKYFAKDAAQWLPEYNEIAAWLTNNGGKGLLCLGNCGRGKTLICGRVIPAILNHYCGKIVSCYDAQQMNADIDHIKQKHIIYLDDIGTESIRVNYGEKRMAFPELVDEAEKRGKLLIITTNLSKDEIKEKYGERTLDRLRAITTPVRFVGKSLR
jgi:DNA replication protein DnaC